MSVISKLNGYIAQHQLFAPTDRLLLAVSGGMDSVVLAHLLHQLGQPFAIAHVNFGLRGAESEGDEAFVRQLALALGVACHVQQLAAAQLAKTEKISLQMAARQLRYAWFEQVRQAQGCARIVTAHHQNDELETVLYHWTKGTGLAGLHGIRPLNGYLARPLICLTRAEIAQYADEQALVWREDSSNASDKYARNLIRHRVVPVLRQLNPQLEKTFGQSIEKIAAVERVFALAVQEFRAQVLTQVDDVFYLSIPKLKLVPEPTIKLFYLLQEFDFNYYQTKLIFAQLDQVAGKEFLSASHWLVIDRQSLVITNRDRPAGQPISIEQEALVASGRLTVCTLGLPPLEIRRLAAPEPPSPALLQLAYDKLRFPLVLRPWQAGDWFVPTGMQGKKRISDFLNDHKVPRNLKGRVWVLCSGPDIAGVVGYRADERFRATGGTVLTLGQLLN